MKNENRIDTYFDKVKKNPPLVEIEKVQQILKEAKVKAEVEVEKGRPNLIKFIVMTTLFAIIIGAFLFWTKAPEEISNSKDHIPNKIEQIIDDAPEIEKGTPDFKSDENSTILIEETNVISTVPERQKPDLSEPVTDYFIEANLQTDNEKIEVGPDIIEPIDGNSFLITANKAMLEKLGFQFRGENIFYQNKSSDGIISVLNYFKVKYDFGTGIVHRTLKDKILEDSVLTNNLDFYPVIVSYKTGTINSSLLPDGFNFELVNDTLYPVCIPQGLVSDDPNDLIVWFKTSDEFFKRIPGNNHPLRKNYDLIKGKKTQMECNLIDYSPIIVLNKSNFIELTDKGLLDVGFYIKEISNPFPGKKGEIIRILEIKTRTEFDCIYKDCAKHVTWRNVLWEEIEIGDHLYESHKKDLTDEVPDFWLSFVSSTEGVILEKINEIDSLAFVNLIPIKVSKQSFGNIIKEDIIFWFRPTDYLFEHLPAEISSDLRKEYNYVIAEDKSSIVKPACKYFDECKNTLDVSSFKVFPNPANNAATVSFTLNEPVDGRITLVDLAGHERQVLQPQTSFAKDSHRINVDVSTVPEGIYLITLYSNKGIQTQRFIVTR